MCSFKECLLHAKLCTYIIYFNPHHNRYDVDSSITPILQMEKLKLIRFRYFAQDHTAREWQSQDVWLCGFKPTILSTVLSR